MAGLDDVFDVVVVGSLNSDVVARTARHPAPGETVLGEHLAEFAGGKGLNQAVAAARAGGAVALVGAVGDDAPGRHLVTTARDAGVDVSHVVVADEEPTGRALIVVDEHGENTIVVVAGANATVSAARVPRGRVILAQLEVPLATVEDALTTARATGATTILNPAPAQPLSPTLLAQCDVIVPNEHEVGLLGGTAALHAAGIATVVVTRGAAGVTISRAGRGATDHPADAADVVDTTGAGDAFCGNLATRLAHGEDLDRAVRWATAAGALAVGRAGAVASLPDRDAVAALVAASG